MRKRERCGRERGGREDKKSEIKGRNRQIK